VTASRRYWNPCCGGRNQVSHDSEEKCFSAQPVTDLWHSIRSPARQLRADEVAVADVQREHVERGAPGAGDLVVWRRGRGSAARSR
jgi:hypothetical protein